MELPQPLRDALGRCHGELLRGDFLARRFGLEFTEPVGDPFLNRRGSFSDLGRRGGRRRLEGAQPIGSLGSLGWGDPFGHAGLGFKFAQPIGDGRFTLTGLGWTGLGHGDAHPVKTAEPGLLSTGAQIAEPVGDLNLGFQTGGEVYQLHLTGGHFGNRLGNADGRRGSFQTFEPFGAPVTLHRFWFVREPFQGDLLGRH